MDDLDPQKFDRDIARAARAERAWRRLLRTDVDRAAAQEWFEPVRYVTTRSTFEMVSELPPGDPRREPLIRWVHRLALTRIAGRLLVDVARARQKPTLELEAPERGTFAPGEVVRRAIGDREAPRARAWLDGLAGASGSLLAAEKRSREGHIEITSRLGVIDPDTLLAFDREAVRAEAERFLGATEDLAVSLLGSRQELTVLVGALIARDVPGVWPRRPDARWLSELFGATPLLEGLAPDIGPIPMPLGASSFARALARFGAAYARVAALGRGPFVLSSDPTDLHPMRRGALFGCLLVDPTFLRQRLGFSREAARRTARALASTVLADARLAAVRTLADFALATPDQIEEGVSEAMKVPVDASLAGAMPRPDARAPQRLVGAWLANGDREMLRDRYDEDWFENPHALLHLREKDAVHRPDRVGSEELTGSVDRFARALEALAS